MEKYKIINLKKNNLIEMALIEYQKKIDNQTSLITLGENISNYTDYFYIDLTKCIGFITNIILVDKFYFANIKFLDCYKEYEKIFIPKNCDLKFNMFIDKNTNKISIISSNLIYKN
jgi:hypothetical protein